METFWKKSENGTFLRVIKTTRTESRINEAAYEGFFPLVKKVQPSGEIHSKFMVVQDKSSGRITVVHDIRTSRFGDLGFGDPIVTEFDGPPEKVIRDYLKNQRRNKVSFRYAYET